MLWQETNEDLRTRAGQISAEPYIFIPDHLEYSELEDKFSLYGYSPDHYRKNNIIRLARIKECALCERPSELPEIRQEKGLLCIQLDGKWEKERNVLERLLIEFSPYNKQVRQTTDGDFIIEIEFYLNEESELVALQLMPFAQYVRILSPDNIKVRIADRIRRQMDLFRDIL